MYVIFEGIHGEDTCERGLREKKNRYTMYIFLERVMVGPFQGIIICTCIKYTHFARIHNY